MLLQRCVFGKVATTAQQVDEAGGRKIMIMVLRQSAAAYRSRYTAFGYL